MENLFTFYDFPYVIPEQLNICMKPFFLKKYQQLSTYL